MAFLPHLQSPPLGWVEDQEALEEVLAVGGHVEGDTVLPPQDTLTQLLQRGRERRGREREKGGREREREIERDREGGERGGERGEREREREGGIEREI